MALHDSQPHMERTHRHENGTKRDEERKNRDAALDQTIEASFPASDPPSTNPNPNDHTALHPMTDASRSEGVRRQRP